MAYSIVTMPMSETQNESLYRFPFFALGGPNEVQLYRHSADEASSIADALIAEVSRIEAKYSRYQADSIVSRINSSAASAPVSVDDETAALLNYAAACFKQSDGLFDITSGVLRRVWNFKSEKLPEQRSIDELLPLIGWDMVEWEKPFIRLPRAGMQIDLGGFGKEYAVDRLAALAMERGVTSALINLGGDVRAVGAKPDGSPFEVGVVHPRRPKEVLATVKLGSRALATSGDYERFMQVAGKRYCHILNPRTGWPVESYQSVSVVSSAALIAGTAATTAMLLGERRGRKFLQDAGLTHLLVSSDGSVSGSLQAELQSLSNV